MQVLTQMFAWVFRLFLLVIGALFVAGLMTLAMVFLVVALLWSAVTGQKHPAQQVWARARATQQQVWRQASRAERGGTGSARSSASKQTDDRLQDVTDVQDLSDKR